MRDMSHGARCARILESAVRKTQDEIAGLRHELSRTGGIAKSMQSALGDCGKGKS